MKYKISCFDIEWDTDPKGDDEYDPKVVAALPKQASVVIEAPDADSAMDWGLGDISDNHGFCIQGCTSKVEPCPE